MPDIIIKNNTSGFGNSKETSVEITGADYINEGLVTAIMDRMNGERKTKRQEQTDGPTSINLRNIAYGSVTPNDLAAAIEVKRLRKVIQEYSEIDIILDTGELVTAVCGYVWDDHARFVFKDCIGQGQMNDEPTNEGGYYKSKGRKNVLEDIYPRLPIEWRKIIKPRTIAEEIGGKRVEYADPLWLPSATDVHGPSEDGIWKDFDGSFQLSIFRRERERVKECGDTGTYSWWLRSVDATSATSFRCVGTGGVNYTYAAIRSLGFAPGFDI